MKIIEHNQRLINVVYSLWFSHPQWSLLGSIRIAMPKPFDTSYTRVHRGDISFRFVIIIITIITFSSPFYRLVLTMCVDVILLVQLPLLPLLPLFCALVVYVYTITWVWANIWGKGFESCWLFFCCCCCLDLQLNRLTMTFHSNMFAPFHRR